MSDPQPKPPQKKPYEPPTIEVVVLSTGEALMAVCFGNPTQCPNPYTTSQVAMAAPPAPEVDELCPAKS